jgi:cytosine/adenosine deaminase-related metal-dependent hydrolase
MPTAILNALIVLPPEQGGPRTTPLRFDRSRILSLDQPPRRGDTILDLEGRMVYPGLVNAHDHLEMNHFPRTKFRPKYDNAHQWGQDFTPQLDEEAFASLRRQPLDHRCQVGGIKNLRSGVTTVAHHNPLHKPLLHKDFVVRVVQRYGWAHSLYFEQEVLRTYRATPRGAPWMIHLAEGTDEVAARELAQLDMLGCLKSNTVLIHGVGLTEADRYHAILAGAGLVWCPSSNLFLLGQTAVVGAFAEAGLLALGSDSRLTADGDMLDEIKAASATGQITPEQLFRAVTTDAARLLRLKAVGALLPGFLPDFFITRRADDPYMALTQLDSKDIEAVCIGGVPRYERDSEPKR